MKIKFGKKMLEHFYIKFDVLPVHTFISFTCPVQYFEEKD